jgi:cytokinin dehydrogenase
MPGEAVAFCFNLIRIPASEDATEARRMVEANRKLYERVRKAGGVLYPVSAFPMHDTDWRAHFGSMWPFLHGAKERYDPLHALTPGYEVF